MICQQFWNIRRSAQVNQQQFKYLEKTGKADKCKFYYHNTYFTLPRDRDMDP
jgi:hypothetical protein